jgi:hypothetical protein
VDAASASELRQLLGVESMSAASMVARTQSLVHRTDLLTARLNGRRWFSNRPKNPGRNRQHELGCHGRASGAHAAHATATRTAASTWVPPWTVTFPALSTSTAKWTNGEPAGPRVTPPLRSNWLPWHGQKRATDVLET